LGGEIKILDGSVGFVKNGAPSLMSFYGVKLGFGVGEIKGIAVFDFYNVGDFRIFSVHLSCFRKERRVFKHMKPISISRILVADKWKRPPSNPATHFCDFSLGGGSVVGGGCIVVADFSVHFKGAGLFGGCRE
jgi:hypothetical protein